MIILGIIITLLLINVWLFATDRYGWSIIAMLGIAVGAFKFVPEFAEFVWMYSWQDMALYGIPAYFGVGAVVASLKWVTFTRGIANRLTKFREKFENSYTDEYGHTLVDNSVDPQLFGGREVNAAPKYTADQLKMIKRRAFIHELDQPSASYRVFNRVVSLHRSNTIQLTDEVMLDMLTPRTRDYIGRVTSWVAQWPIVLIDFVLSDLIIKLGEHIAKLIDTLFNRVARVFVGNAIKGL